MDKPLIYVDQSLLGRVADGQIRLENLDEFQFVYSEVHLGEISRSNEPERYIDALTVINAKLLRMEMDNWRLTGRAYIEENIQPAMCFERYTNNLLEVKAGPEIFHPMVAWFNGGACIEQLKMMPQKFTNLLTSLIDSMSLPFPNDLFCSLESEQDEFVKTLEQSGNNINEFRSAIGLGKGAAGGIDGDDALLQIWKIIEKTCSPLSHGQFYGFENIVGLSDEKIPIYMGIIRCCSILDMIGFCAEKKSRKIDKIANISSDSAHIASAAFCSLLITRDERMFKRAKAIYSYKGIKTHPIYCVDS